MVMSSAMMTYSLLIQYTYTMSYGDQGKEEDKMQPFGSGHGKSEFEADRIFPPGEVSMQSGLFSLLTLDNIGLVSI